MRKSSNSKWTGNILKMLLFMLSMLFIALSMGFLLRRRKMLREVIVEKAKKYGLDLEEALNLADLLLAQAKHETGKFKSKSYTIGHNLFGMKLSSRKIAKSEYLGHAKYSSDADSIEDMFQYLKSSRVYTLEQVSAMSPLQYVTYLKSRNYYEDSLTNYFNGVSKFYVKGFEV